MIHSPLDILHTIIVLSQDPEAKYFPFGENATLLTLFLWPVKVLMHSPLKTLHNPILLNPDPDVKYLLFGENAMLFVTPE